METENYKEILSKRCRPTMPWKFSTGGCKMDMKLVLTCSTLDHVNAIYAWHVTSTVYWNVLYCLDCNLSAVLLYENIDCKAAFFKKWWRILLSWKRTCAGDVPWHSAVAKAIPKSSQLLLFDCTFTFVNFSYTNTSGCFVPIVLTVTQWLLPLWRIWMNSSGSTLKLQHWQCTTNWKSGSPNCSSRVFRATSMMSSESQPVGDSMMVLSAVESLTRSLSIQGYILGRATNRVDVFCV